MTTNLTPDRLTDSAADQQPEQFPKALTPENRLPSAYPTERFEAAILLDFDENWEE